MKYNYNQISDEIRQFTSHALVCIYDMRRTSDRGTLPVGNSAGDSLVVPFVVHSHQCHTCVHPAPLSKRYHTACQKTADFNYGLPRKAGAQYITTAFS